MNQKVLIWGSVVFVLLIIFGIYLFTKGPDYEDLAKEKNQLEAELLLAQEKLAEEEAKLEQMLAELRQSFQLSFAIQDQIGRTNDLLSRTDFLFSGLAGSDGGLEKFFGADLLNSRNDINFLISEWRKKLGTLAVGKINKEEAAKILAESEIIKKYLESLTEAVLNITPDNSGLTQEQINQYVNSLPSAEEMEDIISAIESAVENLSNSQNPSVTPEEVAEQEEIVREAQEEVERLEEEIEEIEEEMEGEEYPTPYPDPNQSYGYQTPPDIENYIYPTPAENYSYPSPGSSYATPATYTGGEPLPYYPTPYSRPKYNGIIVQPGPPSLIPGSDPY